MAAVHKRRHYFLGYHFIIIINHKSLKDLMCQVIQTSEQQHYLAKVLGYNYSIQYKPISDKVAENALSRIDVTLGHHFSLSMPHFQFLDCLHQSLHEN